MPTYFDIHSHLNFADFEADLDEVIGRLKETGTHTIVVGTDLESSRRAVELAEKYDGIYASIGIHPVDKPSRSFEALELNSLVPHPKVVAIGECGLDFFHIDRENKEEVERQTNLFLEQINLAVSHDKPLMIHVRDSYDEILSILTPLKRDNGDRMVGNIHFFAGTKEQAKKFINLGFTLSFTGVITFARDYDDVIKCIPLDMIMSETDAPYVAPAPYRGKRNEPSYVSEVVKKIAEIRGDDLETVQKALISNAHRVFGI